MNLRAGEGYGEDDRLPWLETVEEDYREGPSLGRLVLLIVLVLLVAGAAVAGYFWYTQSRGLSGNGELIEAQPGDYKIKPDEPGGMKVSGEGDQVFATSQGTAANPGINAGALPEAPIDGTRASATGPAGEGSKNAKLAMPSATKPRAEQAAASQAGATAAGGSGSVIQLGAFPNEAGANAVWTRMSKRFAYLAPLGKSVERSEVDGKAIWRLRVNAGSNGQARELCGKLKIAGENCYIAN